MSSPVQKNRNVPQRYVAAHGHRLSRFWYVIVLVFGAFGLLFCVVCTISWGT